MSDDGSSWQRWALESQIKILDYCIMNELFLELHLRFRNQETSYFGSLHWNIQ